MVMLPNATWSSALLDGVLLVRLSGELDCSNVPEIYERVRLEIHDVPCHCLVVDLSAVTFVDSEAVSFLLKAKRSIESTGGSIEVCGIRPQAWRVLEIMGVLAALAPASTR